MPYFSILIPVCNQYGKMDRCFDCIDNQTFKDFEVIFVDDGSKDDSVKMLESFCNNKNNMKVMVHSENKSLLCARITAMKEAKGEYIVFLDSDDALEVDALEKIYSYVNESNIDILRFATSFSSNKEPMLPKKVDDCLYSYLKGETPPSVWKNCYKKDVIKKSVETMDNFYCNMSEDNYLSTVFFSNANVIKDVNDLLYIYSDDGGMSSSKTNFDINKFLKSFNSSKEAGEHIVSYVEKYNQKYLDIAKKCANRIKRFAVSQCILYEENWGLIIDILHYLKENKEEDSFLFGCKVVLSMKFCIINGQPIKYDWDGDI